MSEIEKSTTLQCDVLETNAAGLAADEAPPTATGQETTIPPGDPPVTATSLPKEPAEKEEKRPISPQKLAANRANAERSTGPRTAEGKEKSKQNSRKHGFFARQPLPTGEVGDKLWQAYRELAAGIWEYYEPVGYMEGLLTEKVITESIRLSRLLEFESQYLGQRQAFHMNGVDRILRFQSSINRQLFQAIKELERVQDKRKENPTNHPDREPGGEDNG